MNITALIHTKRDKRNLIKVFYIALIILIAFGFYKNGIYLYIHDLISLFDVFIFIYFYVISILIGFILAKLMNINKGEMILFSLIVTSTLSINTNLIIYPILLFISLFISFYLAKRWEFNPLVLAHLLMIIALFLGKYQYANIGESLEIFNYNLFDIFIGFGVGGISSSSLLLVLLSFLILASNPFYRRNIPIASFLSFIIILLGVFFITQDLSYLEKLLNGNVYFGFVFIATYLYSGPDTKKDTFIYGLALGIISALLVFIIPIYEAYIVAIFLCSIIYPIIHKIYIKKYLQDIESMV